MEKKSIYELELHESIAIHSFLDATRVPGGWIYESIGEDVVTSTFVPFDNEFQSSKKKN